MSVEALWYQSYRDGRPPHARRLARLPWHSQWPLTIDLAIAYADGQAGWRSVMGTRTRERHWYWPHALSPTGWWLIPERIGQQALGLMQAAIVTVCRRNHGAARDDEIVDQLRRWKWSRHWRRIVARRATGRPRRVWPPPAIRCRLLAERSSKRPQHWPPLTPSQGRIVPVLEERDMLTISNDGPRIRASNYWGTDYARRGAVYVSVNAGAFRLLLPDSVIDSALGDMLTARDVIVSRGPWPAQRRTDAIEILFDDGSASPFALHIGIEQIDRLPLDTDTDREWTCTLWGPGPRQLGLRPAWYRRVAQLPDLSPWRP